MGHVLVMSEFKAECFIVEVSRESRRLTMPVERPSADARAAAASMCMPCRLPCQSMPIFGIGTIGIRNRNRNPGTQNFLMVLFGGEQSGAHAGAVVGHLLTQLGRHRPAEEQGAL